MGTGVGGKAVGEINASPAADLPLGMMQWGPDTLPVRAPGGGYLNGQPSLSGFSLTHISGPGCPGYGDIPILPTVGPRRGQPGSRPWRSSAHPTQHATPGSYQGTFGDPAVGLDLAVTTRTGLARITFPATHDANVVFKVGDSATGASAAQVQRRRRPRADRIGDLGQLLRHPGLVHAVLRRGLRPSVRARHDVERRRPHDRRGTRAAALTPARPSRSIRPAAAR